MTNPKAAGIGYRADIDGLRALAVWPVVLFHSELGIVSGGFVGVDIFFVISGYLITGILLRELREERFSLLDFYARRVRRIFPALFTMLAICGVLGAIFMFPRDLETLGLNLAAASGSVSNIALLSEVDYFDGDAKLKPLLHTWSLALEEQYYLLWPLLLMALAGRRRSWLLMAGSAIAVISLVTSVWYIQYEPDDVFYLLPFRCWELLIGSLLAAGLVPRIRSRRLAAWAAALGFAMIIYAVVAFSDEMVFPGLAALVPCIGAALIIHAGQCDENTPVGQLLASPLMTFFGKISYSFYLWHWPLFAFLRYQTFDEPNPAAFIFGLIPLALICATLSWYFVERPFREKQLLKSRFSTLTAGIVAIACGITAGSVLFFGNGLPQRFRADVVALSEVKDTVNPYKVCSWAADHGENCIIGSPGEVDVMLWGDSHAGALWAAADALTGKGHSTQYAASSGCPALYEMGTSRECIALNRKHLQFVLDNDNIRSVVLVGRWSLYFQGRALRAGPAETNSGLPRLLSADGTDYDQFTPEAQEALARGIGGLVKRLTAAGKQVILVYPGPEIGYDVPFALARMEDRGISSFEFGLPMLSYRKRQQPVFEILDSFGNDPLIERVYPAEVLCPDENCTVARDGQPLYTDSNHVSPLGARLMAPLLEEAIGQRPD
ncbi:peptidoglycan/LPS O-acetylase OafA/YrhL [Altererythrobacter atlanticus]|uniref:acyltransferase family protein n=1 Tax=Croceibacterium atlanticum TaxID=1267766 RepID=UPI00062C14EA|nr:acyltransferase family protein [Croceibacterium atlanticum]MBB5731631.1 peptidoglycan/LPS O-acetylase OafA/YrhL [Croceibacterium atlanticum]